MVSSIERADSRDMGPSGAADWWARRWLRYNVILVAAAPVSFVCLLVVWGLYETRLPCLEITGFTVFGGAVLFAVGLALANVFYLLAPLVERLVRPGNEASFRSRLFALGTAFSLLLIFSPVIGNLLAAAIGPAVAGQCR